MTEVKARIAAIDAFGRQLAASVNERIEGEGLVGQSPATIRRVEELISFVLKAADPLEDDDLGVYAMPADFEFHVIGKGITAKPFVSPARYTGKVVS